MIWVRRLLAVPLGLLFMWLLIGGLLLIHLEGSLLSPAFHKDQLEKAGVYTFILEDLPRAAVEEFKENYASEDDTLTDVVLPVVIDDVPESIAKVIPPSWLQEQVEQVIEQVGGYLAGKRDDFQVYVPLYDRATALSAEVRTLMPYDTLYDHVMVELVRPSVDDALADGDAAPLGAPIGTDDVVASIERAFPRDWVAGQADAALAEATAYLVGDKDTMEVRVALDERSHVALEEAKSLLRKADNYQIVFEGIINPVLEDTVPEVVYLPLGVTVTREEVMLAFLDNVPPEWLNEQGQAVIDAAGPYVIGETDAFRVVIPMAERKSNANQVIAALARIKLRAAFDEMPKCEASTSSISMMQSGLPQCVPPDVPREMLDSLIEILASELQNVDLDELIRGFGYQIPDEIVYTHEDMREALFEAGGEEAVESLDYVREVSSQGWTYTDADLRADLLESGGIGDVEALEDLRSALRDGLTFTDADLRQSLREGGGEAAVSQLDRIRDQLSRAWLIRVIVLLLAVALLVAIAFLGGRNWWSRLAWAGATLSISAVIAAITYTILLDAVVPEMLAAWREEMLRDSNAGPTAFLVMDKAVETLRVAADSFLGRARGSSLILLILGLAAFMGSLVWRRVDMAKGA